jgi:hypothetical protein
VAQAQRLARDPLQLEPKTAQSGGGPLAVPPLLFAFSKAGSSPSATQPACYSHDIRHAELTTFFTTLVSGRFLQSIWMRKPAKESRW